MPQDKGAPSLVVATEPVPPERMYRGWEITWDYGHFTATGPDYDASWEGEEDGWVDNGHRVSARTRDDLIAEVDAWFEDHPDAAC
jgi:hypothetical protein